MSNFRRHPADTEIELKIITALIVSTKFCKDVFPILDQAYFQISYGKRIITWIKDYYKTYGTSPGKHIQDIFKAERSDIDKAEADVIETFLTNLSKNYEETEKFNVEYVLDSSLEYLNKRALRAVSENIKTLLDAGKVDKAEEQMQSYRKVAKVTSSWVNPFSPKIVRKIFDEEGDHLVKFPGKLGELVGDFDRGWFVSFLAPFKRGKTWWLQELAIQALLSRWKVVFISLEMGYKRVIRRMYKEITGKGDTSGSFIFPCFDCFSNQNGSCTSRNRVGSVPLFDSEGKSPPFKAGMKYKPCTYCRGKIPELYKSATWFELYSKRRASVRGTIKTLEGFKTMYGDNLRVISYPRFSANTGDIKRDLDLLEYTDNFIPDVIVIDYADILAPEDSRLVERRDRIDDTWKTLGGMTEERHCLLATASQSTRGSADKKNVRSTDVAEDIRKMAHVDVMIPLSQTAEEKRRGVMRIGLAAHRDKDFDESKQVVVLQQLSLGQPNLDSELIINKEPKKDSNDSK